MGRVLHGSARTTTAVRAAIQRSQESLQILGKRHGVNSKTVVKWRKRTTVVDAPMGPKPVSTVLTAQAADFLRRVVENLPYKVHKVLPDNGTLFGNMPHQT